MGRFNWIWRTLRTLSVIACAVWLPSATAAFTADEYKTLPIGTCIALAEVDVGLSSAIVSLFHTGMGGVDAGGAYWGVGGGLIIRSPITEGILENCLGLPAGGVANLVQTGADSNKTFSTQTYMGFSFTLTDIAEEAFPGVYVEGDTYPSYIGTPPPTADAGPDQTVASGATVTLDVAGTSGMAQPFTYVWRQIDTSGSTVDLSNINAAQPTFIAPALGVNDGVVTLEFSLEVTNSNGDISTADTVSITVNPETASAASDFAAKEDAIRSVITDDATRSLTSTLNANERMVGEARERLIASLQEGADLATRDNVPFDVDGTFNLDGSRLSTKGTFFEQRGTADGAGQRLFFGDFDVQHDGDTNSTTATITARMAWEQMYTDSTMLGYFVGGELAHSNIKGSFEGEQDRLGVSFGGYAVHQIDEQVFVDGFITVGAGRNNLEIADATLDLTSDYTTRTATMGAAVSGVYEYGQYDFHPELAFSYGKTWIGDVGFTGVAYGLTDDTLSLDAGDVSIANLTLRPEIVWALDAETVADSNTQLSFAPRFICQRTSAVATTQDCGAGAEVGLSSTSEDGLSSAHIRLVMDRVGTSNRSSFALNFERSF